MEERIVSKKEARTELPAAAVNWTCPTSNGKRRREDFERRTISFAL
jgi:hypothetical protein